MNINQKIEHDYWFHSKINSCDRCGFVPNLVHNVYEHENGRREHSYTFNCRCKNQSKTYKKLFNAIIQWNRKHKKKP